jgi:hypothetical protein
MNIRNFLVFVAASFLATTMAHAVKVDGPEEAENNSTHILVGTVTGIYSKLARDASNETKYSVAEIKVDSVEKGDGIKPLQLVYARFISSIQWIGKGSPPPGPGGHENIPTEGQVVKVCLVRNADGSFDVYYVSGFKTPGRKKN